MSDNNDKYADDAEVNAAKVRLFDQLTALVAKLATLADMVTAQIGNDINKYQQARKDGK